MRKVVGNLFISLDMVAESPDQWQYDNFDEDMAVDMIEQLKSIDTVLLGRVTYQEWKDYWPSATSDQDFAAFINNVPKYVASTTLESVEWGSYNTITLFNGSLAEEVGKLKQAQGQTIAVNGSPGLVRSLILADLLDELRLYVHPVIVNKGKKLFHDGDALKRLKLVEAKATRTGVAVLVYRPLR